MFKKIVIMLLFLSFIPSVVADVTFYGDVTLYLDNGDISVTFVDSGITLYYCEFQDSSNYILLENLNLTMTCSGSLAVNVSEVNNTANLTSGTTVLRFNATYTGGSVLFGFDGNHSNAFYDVYVDSVKTVSSSNMDSFSFTQSSWSTKDIDIQLSGYYPDPPYSGSSDYNTSDNTLNLTWSRGNYSDREVVIRSNTSYPSSPSDGTEVYNGTDLYYDTSIFQDGFHTVWSYNDTTNTFSRTGEDIPWGAIGIAVYNESNHSQAISPFGLLISNQAGTSTYQNSSCSNTHYLDLLNIPYGTNTIIRINSSGYRSRNFIKTLNPNHFYNYTFYLPPFETPVDPYGGDEGGSGTNYSTTQNYLVQVINEVNEPVSNAVVTVTRYLNGSYSEVASSLTDGYGQTNSIPLIPDVLYKVNITADNYNPVLGQNWIPDPIYFGAYYPKIFKLTAVDSNFTNETYWFEIISWDVGLSGSSLFINMTDSDSITQNVTFYIYEYNHSTNTSSLFSSVTNYSEYDISIVVSSVNSSNTYTVVMYHNSSVFGLIKDTKIVDGHPWGYDTDPLTDKTSVDKNFGVLGDNPFGWSNFLGFIMLIIGFFAFGQRNIGIGMFLTGIIMLGVQAVIGLDLIASSVWVLIMILGILVQWRVSRRLRTA